MEFWSLRRVELICSRSGNIVDGGTKVGHDSNQIPWQGDQNFQRGTNFPRKNWSGAPKFHGKLVSDQLFRR